MSVNKYYTIYKSARIYCGQKTDMIDEGSTFVIGKYVKSNIWIIIFNGDFDEFKSSKKFTQMCISFKNK